MQKTRFQSVKNLAKSAWQTAKERAKEFWKFDHLGIEYKDRSKKEGYN